MVKKISRRALLGTATVAATSSFATPALSLSREFLENRGDLRIGMLSDYPPYVFLRAGVPYVGILPTIGKIFADELWLSPSYSLIHPEQYLNFALHDLFSLYSGLDVILHVPVDIAEKEQALRTVDYIEDSLAFIGLPDVREIGLFPSTFYKRDVLAFPDQLFHRDIKESRDISRLDIDYNTSLGDVLSSIPLERLLNNEFRNFIAPRRQLEWMNGASVHKFHVNDLFNYGKSTRRKFCAIVNPDSAWILEPLQQRLVKFRESYDLQLIYNKYDLVLTV